MKRIVSDSEKQFALNSFHEHQQRLVQALTPESLLIDCHSFPSDLSETDICIGINEDWSRPDDSLIHMIISHFRSKGYSVGVNEPYSNSISPEAGFQYSSLMIEANKRAYLQGDNELDINKASNLRQCVEECFLDLLIC